MNQQRLAQQLVFLSEIEKLKMVYRRNRVVDQSRFENSAEHSWNIALMALVLQEYADLPDLDMFRVVKLLLVHDLVEIYAGDTWLYDPEAVSLQADKELQSAQSLFALLPEDQAQEFMDLWLEFEARETNEAIFAVTIDALQPLTNHLESGIVDPTMPMQQQVLASKQHIANGSALLWEQAQRLIAECTAKGLFRLDA